MIIEYYTTTMMNSTDSETEFTGNISDILYDFDYFDEDEYDALNCTTDSYNFTTNGDDNDNIVFEDDNTTSLTTNSATNNGNRENDNSEGEDSNGNEEDLVIRRLLR